MRCAVSGGPGPGSSRWMSEMGEAGVEFVPVGDAPDRLTELMESQKVEAVLLTGRDGTVADDSTGRGGGHARQQRTEREMVRFARARRLPIVGIGPGAEFLGLYFGGRLRQQPGNRLLDLRIAAWVGIAHASVQAAGQMICDPEDFPTPLTPFAWDGQGNIAGFIHRDEPILGIHWEPSGHSDPATGLILEELRGCRRIAS